MIPEDSPKRRQPHDQRPLVEAAASAAARLPEDCIHLDCSLSTLEASGDGGVLAHFDREASPPLSVEADLVIGADGINSALRSSSSTMGLRATRGGRSGVRSSPSMTTCTTSSPGGCSMSAGAGKVGFLTDIGQGELYWSAFATDEAVAEGALQRDDFPDVKSLSLAQFSEVYKLRPCLERTPTEAILERRVADRAPLVDGDGKASIPGRAATRTGCR